MVKVLFVYDHKYPYIWDDGLAAGLKFLAENWKQDYQIFYLNLSDKKADKSISQVDKYDFMLGWGAFNSPVDQWIVTAKSNHSKKKYGLCIAGNAFPPDTMNRYDVLFYETEWYKPQIEKHKNIFHAFGVNTNIYRPMKLNNVWDWITVGSFSFWKRQEKLLDKEGTILAIGEIQIDNLDESMQIIGPLMVQGCMISNMVHPYRLAQIYNMSHACYIPAELEGGGERAVLEARACGIEVDVEDDNPKLKELCYSEIWDYKYYAEQLKKGVDSCLK